MSAADMMLNKPMTTTHLVQDVRRVVPGRGKGRVLGPKLASFLALASWKRNKPD